jgi:hypothetical protein
VHLSSPADISLNVGVPIMAPRVPTATLWGYEPATRALVGYGSPHPIGPGGARPRRAGLRGRLLRGLRADRRPAYLLDPRWPGHFILDGQSGGFCRLAKRLLFSR